MTGRPQDQASVVAPDGSPVAIYHALPRPAEVRRRLGEGVVELRLASA